jgi:hypothetical protein
LVSLLQMLYAKLALSDREIVESHLIRRRGFQPHIPVRKHNLQEPISYHVGEGSIYTHAVLLHPSDPIYDAEWQDSSE